MTDAPRVADGAPMLTVPAPETPPGWSARNEWAGPAVTLLDKYSQLTATIQLTRPSLAGAGEARLAELKEDVLEQVRGVMGPSAARKERIRLVARLADARCAVGLAVALHKRLTAEIAWTEAAAAPGFGKVVIELERQAAEADRDKQAAQAEVRVLEPRVEQASRQAQAEVKAAFPSLYAAARAALEGERDRTRQEIVAAVVAAAGPLLDRLAGLESAVARLGDPEMAVLDVMVASRERWDGDDDAAADAPEPAVVAPIAETAAAAEPVSV